VLRRNTDENLSIVPERKCNNVRGRKYANVVAGGLIIDKMLPEK
jgi:hypothetical protein